MSARKHRGTSATAAAAAAAAATAAAAGSGVRGAASVASSSSVTHASSSAASSSLTSTFAALTAADVAFFDAVIASTAASSSSTADFASLKAAYEAVSQQRRRQQQQQQHRRVSRAGARDENDEDSDPRRWDTLLRLVQVRGRTWPERWDAVRMALGLSPRPSSSSERDSDSEDRSSSRSIATTSSPSDTRRQGSYRTYPRGQQADDDEQHSPSAGSNADTDSSSIARGPAPPSSSRARTPVMPATQHTPTSRVHFASSSSTPTPTSARQRTLEALTARAGSLALAAGSSAAAGGSRASREEATSPRSQRRDVPQRSANTPRRPTVQDAREQDEDTEDDLFATEDDDNDALLDFGPPAGVSARAYSKQRQQQQHQQHRQHAAAQQPRSTSGKAVLADLIRAVQRISVQDRQRETAQAAPSSAAGSQNRRGNASHVASRRPPASLRASHAELSQSFEQQGGEVEEGDEDDTERAPRYPPVATASTSRITQEQHRRRASREHLNAHQAHIHAVVQRARAERDRLRRASSGPAGAGNTDSETEGQQQQQQRQHEAALRQAADDWGRRVLLTKALSWWVTLTRRSHARAAHIDRVRSTFTCRRALSLWIDAAASRAAVQERAGRIDEVRVVVRAWNLWMERVRERAEQRREERREGIKGAFRAVVEMRNSHAREAFFRKWQEQYNTRLADAVRREHLQRGALALWTLAATKMARLHSREAHWTQSHAHTTRSTLWTLWKARAAERVWARARAEHTKHATWTHWRRAAQLAQLARVLERHRLLQSALSAWLRAHAGAQHLQRAEHIAARWGARSLKRRVLGAWGRALEARKGAEEAALRFRVRVDLVRLRGMLVLWALREREGLLGRVRAARALGGALERWKERTRAVQTRFEAEEEVVRARRDAGLVREGFERLRAACGLHLALGNAAGAWARKRRLQGALDDWRAKLRRRRREEEEAGRKDAAVLLKGAWSTWVERRRERKAQAAVEARQNHLKESAFDTWRMRASRKAAHRLDKIRARTHDAEQTQRHFLTRWTARIIQVRDTYYAASVRADKNLVASAWGKWKDTLIAHGEMLGLVDSFQEVKEQERLERMFDFWIERANESMNRKASYDAIVERREGRLLRTAWDAWVDRRVDTALRSLEYQAVLVRKQAVLRRAFGRWKRQTQTLPAISFNLAKLKLRALDRWLEALPRAQNRRLAVQLEREWVLPRFWEAWVQAAKVERNLRAAERFGGISMRKFKSVSGRVKMVVSPPSAGTAGPSGHPHGRPASAMGKNPARAGGRGRVAGGMLADGTASEGRAGAGSPVPSSTRGFTRRGRRWSLGPTRDDEED